MTSPSVVRPAVPADEASLMALCASLHGENAAFTRNDDKVRAMLHRAFAKQGVSIGVIGPVDAVEAAIVLMISSYWYSDMLHLEELFNYVHPSHRKSKHATSLLKFARRCSDEFDIPLNIGVMSGKRTASKINLYRKIFGYPIGVFFLYNNKWAKLEGQPSDESLFFWDNPFPRPGVAVFSTNGWTKLAIDVLSTLIRDKGAGLIGKLTEFLVRAEKRTADEAPKERVNH